MKRKAPWVFSAILATLVFVWLTSLWQAMPALKFKGWQTVNGEKCGRFELTNPTSRTFHYPERNGSPEIHFREQRPGEEFLGPGPQVGGAPSVKTLAPGASVEFTTPLRWHFGGQPMKYPFAVAVKVFDPVRQSWRSLLVRWKILRSPKVLTGDNAWSEFITP